MIGGEFGKQINFPPNGTGDTILGFEYPRIPKEWKKLDWKSHSEGSWAIYGISLDGTIIPDILIAEIINKSDWFTLSKEFPKAKENIKDTGLKWVSEALLHAYFNRPERALSTIATISAQYGEEVGAANLLELVKTYLNISFSTLGNFKGTYEASSSFLGSLKNNNFPDEVITYFTELNKYHSIFKDFHSTEILRPDTDVEIPFGVVTITTNRKNDTTSEIYLNEENLPVVKINIHEKDYIFLFDTGCSQTILFEKTANELNLQRVFDHVEVKGIGSANGSLAQLDSLSLGSIIVKNSLVTITENFFLKISNDGSAEVFAGVLGLDVMKRLGEIQIAKNGEKYKMTVPVQQTDAFELEHNILIDLENRAYILATLDHEPAVFHFDTGNTSTDLTANYFQKHRTYIEANLTKECSCNFGVGGGKENDIYVLSKLNVKVGGVNYIKEKVPIFIENKFASGEYGDGALGADFLFSFDKVTLNFDKMFVRVE